MSDIKAQFHLCSEGVTKVLFCPAGHLGDCFPSIPQKQPNKALLGTVYPYHDAQEV